MAGFTFTQDKEVFNAKKCLAYPSANSQNSGQLNSEENIRWIMLRLTKRSFTLTEQDFKLSYEGNSNPSVLKIAGGTANIDGYYFRCDEVTTVEIDNDTNTGFFNGDAKATILSQLQIAGSDVLFYVKFKKNVDASDHLLTYTDNPTQQTNLKFLGFSVTLTTETPTVDELYLGTIRVKAKNGKLYITEVKSNPYKCMFINSSSIYADEDALGAQDRTLFNLIKYIVQQVFTTGIGDLILYGNNNNDGTTNILLSDEVKRDSGDASEHKYLRLYYNADSKKGGLALIDQLNKLALNNITNTNDIFTFDFNEDRSPTMKIHINSFTIGNNGIVLDDDGNVTIKNNLTVGGTYKSSKGGIELGSGNITTNGVVRADKVYGAVWS